MCLDAALSQGLRVLLTSVTPRGCTPADPLKLLLGNSLQSSANKAHTQANSDGCPSGIFKATGALTDSALSSNVDLQGAVASSLVEAELEASLGQQQPQGAVGFNSQVSTISVLMSHQPPPMTPSNPPAACSVCRAPTTCSSWMPLHSPASIQQQRQQHQRLRPVSPLDATAPPGQSGLSGRKLKAKVAAHALSLSPPEPFLYRSCSLWCHSLCPG